MANRPQRMNSGQKAENFKEAMKRTIKELKSFHVLIIISLILACAGSILTIFTPNILSDMTDSISDGLKINQDNLDLLTKEMQNQLNDEKMQTIIKMDLSEENIKKVMHSSSISEEEKSNFNAFLNNPSLINTLSENILAIIVKDNVVNNINIPASEIISLIKNHQFSENILRATLNDIKIKDMTITTEELITTSQILMNMDEEKAVQSLSSLPESVQKLISSKVNLTKIKKFAIILISLYLISALFSYTESILMTNVSNKFAQKLRKNISMKINRLPLKFFDKNARGDILSRVTNDVDSVAQSLDHSLATLVSALTLFVGTTIMMFVTNFTMAITAIVASLIGFSFMGIILKRSQKYFIARQTELGNLNGHIEEVYSGLNVIKAYNGQNIMNAKFDDLNNKVYEANCKSQFLSGLMMPLMNFIGNFGYVAVCIVGALLTSKNIISFGVIIAFISYVRLFTSPLNQIAQAMNRLQSTAAASERVFKFLDEEEMLKESENKRYLANQDVKGNIEFKNVSFTYDGNEKPTIKDFSAKIKAGQKVAIVGPTGAGKTTIVNLLMKFYEISDGDIIIDGNSIHDLTRENIHSLFTMILQDTWLFEGTIKENIVYNRSHVGEVKVQEVCQTVGLDHFIKTLPNGYNSEVKDNDMISAGQKQLMTIARGMIEDAPFLILDEATSNVDTRTEELVQSSMDKLTEGRTSFIIAHRLSTIKNADLILVMKDGNIIEQGTHEELLKLKGFYSELYNSQFEL